MEQRAAAIGLKVNGEDREFHGPADTPLLWGAARRLWPGAMRAEERLAAFLLNLSLRFGRRGYSRSDFHLRMTREEIGSYLGLTTAARDRVP